MADHTNVYFIVILNTSRLQIIVTIDKTNMARARAKLLKNSSLSIVSSSSIVGSSSDQIILNSADLHENDRPKLARLVKKIKSDLRASKVIIAPLKAPRRIKPKGTVKSSSSDAIVDDTSTRKNRKHHFFLDIDRTATVGNTKSIDVRVIHAFKQMKQLGHHIFFASGRSFGDMNKAINEAHTDEQGIAENGGVIINGVGSADTILGDKSMCECAFEKLQSTDLSELHEAPGPLRKSEVILEKQPYTQIRINKAIKKHKLPVQIIASPTSYHMSKKGVDKGIALNEFLKIFQINPNSVVSMGDSELDIPMFKQSVNSIAVNNSKSLVKKFAKYCVPGDFSHGVLEGFRMFDNRFNPNAIKPRS